MPAMLPQETDQTTTRQEWRSAGTILLAAAAWRFIGLGAESLWTDEIAAVLVARRSLLEVLATIAVQDVNPPLYYLLLHCWTWLGQPEWWLRLLSALGGLGVVALTWRLGRRLAGPAVGLIAALFAAFSPLEIYLSREVRYHTLAGVLALGALLLFLRRLDEPAGRRARALVAVLTLGLYTHYYFLFVPLIAALWWWYENDERPVPAQTALVPLGLALLAFAPWLLVIAMQSARASYRFRPLTGLFDTLFDLAGYFSVGHADAQLPFDPRGWNRLWFLLALAPFWLLGALGVACWRNSRAARLAGLGLGVPLLIVLVASRVVPVYGHRYLLPLLPFFFLLLALGAERLRAWRRIAGLVAVVAVCGLMTASNLLQFADRRYQRENWRDLATVLRQTMKPGDVLLGYNKMQIGPLNYYWLRQTGRPLLYAPLLTGDPLVFASPSAAAVEARVALYRSRFERLWLVDHFAHMYDPAGIAHAALDRQTVYDARSAGTADWYHIPLRVYWRDRPTLINRSGGVFSAKVDFSRPVHSDLQLFGEWTRPAKQWAWIGA